MLKLRKRRFSLSVGFVELQQTLGITISILEMNVKSVFSLTTIIHLFLNNVTSSSVVVVTPVIAGDDEPVIEVQVVPL